jgi:eukaryotic-like serine/threonine-protein kinase
MSDDLYAQPGDGTPETRPPTTTVDGDDAPVARPPRTAHPTVVGRYHVVGLLGEGGMGLVYKAEQRQPLHRTVALKFIKLGMDSEQVLARFESERRALALMNHSNIAGVLDAGIADDG